jgi:Phosphotransferase enzyme family
MCSFLLAAVDSERTWILRHAAQATSSRCRRFPFYNATAHLELLNMLALAIPHITPPFTLSSPTLWHADISHSNLFVAETGPAEVQGLIDWQHSTVAPYCMQATFPSIFTYDGGLISIPEGRVAPKLPSHVSALSPDQQVPYRLHLKLAMRHKAYEHKIATENERRMIVCAMPFGAELALLPYHVLRSWSDSLVPLRQALLHLRDVWELFADEGSQCPIHFTDNELQNHEQELRQYTKYQESITSLDDDLGCGGDGWVPDDEFSRVMTKLKERKANWDDEVNGGPFPYENGSFSFLS